ncbi:MAG: hypothetical protein MJZ96_01240 [Paludibacteraceae bacterium]|nr:hypothetical protein [Paludibacteraceae bacterium]
MKKIFMMIACAVLLMSTTTAKAQIYSSRNNDILSNHDFEEVMFEDNQEEFDGVLADLSIGVKGGLTGETVRPFESGRNNKYNADVQGRVRPGGDPTNQIPVGSGLCLAIGLMLFIAARVLIAIKRAAKEV